MPNTYPTDREDQALCCPHCGDTWLYNKTPYSGDNKLNIPIGCETCSKTSALVLRRHKGQLFIRWINGAHIKLEIV